MRRIIFYGVICLFLNACSSVPTPKQYDMLLRGEAGDESMTRLVADAESGDAELQFYLGTLHENGRFTKISKSKAIGWYRMAAQQGSEKGQTALLRMLNESAIYTDQKYYAELGDYYLQGLYVPQDREKALEIYKAAAPRGGEVVQRKLIKLLRQISAESCADSYAENCVQNRAEAQYQLAMLYRTGRYLEKDAVKSKQLMQQAASKGNSGALIKSASDLIGEDNTDWFKIRNMLESVTEHSAWSASALGNLYYLGTGGEVDKEKSLYYYQISAELGNAKAANYAFYMHQQEETPNAKKEKAGHYLWLAAKVDDGDARDRLAKAYFYGEYGVPEDEGAAAYLANSGSDLVSAWLCKEAYYPNVPKSCINGPIAKMVRKGHPFAQYLMGDIYAEGAGIDKNIDRAISLYKSAIAKGEYAAKVALAEFYLEGKSGQDDTELGLALLHEMQNDGDPGAAQALGKYAFEHKDYSLALTLSLQAEKEGWLGEDTYYHLYRLYSGKIGTPGDAAKSNHYLIMALNEFHPIALYDKAISMLDEKTTAKRTATAIELLQDSGRQAHVPAMLKLAAYYTSLNQPEQAAVWTLEAAAHGDADSQRIIGETYAGKQTLKDMALARYWYGKAEQQGDREAIAWMAKFGEGNLDVDSKGNLCDEHSESYCYSRAISRNPLNYFRQRDSRKMEHKLRLYADGAVEFSEELQPFAGWLPYLNANVTQVWPTHCGFAMQRATGSGVLLFSRTQQFCQPPQDVVRAAFQHGIRQVAKGYNATGLVLGNGQVVAWGADFNGGGLILPTAYPPFVYNSLEEEVKVKRAVAKDVVKLVSGVMSMAALKPEGQVYIWGDDSADIGHQLPGRYKDVMANGYFDGYCTRNIDDQISCWKERGYKYQQHFPDNIQQFDLVENAFMALSIDEQGDLTAWPMYGLGTDHYTAQRLPASLADYFWTAIGKEQVSDGFVTVLTRSDGERFAVRFSTNQFSVRPFKRKN